MAVHNNGGRPWRWFGGAVVWVFKHIGYDRLARLYHVCRIRDRAWMDGFLRFLLNNEKPENPLGRSFVQHFFKDELQQTVARWIGPTDVDVLRQLEEIPSETTIRERHFLWSYFANAWSGHGDIVEIGSFLGGTTRAIALGMMANCRRDPTARLHTYDRFASYYDRAALQKFAAPLVERGAIRAAQLEALGPKAEFRGLFDAIHHDTSYGSLLVVHNQPLPGSPEEDRAGLRFSLAQVRAPEAFFVDGCKSWYGTKVFMRESCRSAQPGAVFIFQDYLQYTCFWLPAFVETFAGCFRLMATVDCTCAFQLLAPLAPDEIQAEFPDSPEAWPEGRVDAIFGHLVSRSDRAQAHEAKVKQTIQWAAVHAYAGRGDRAVAMLDSLLAAPEAEDFATLLASARLAPTYRPNGDLVRLPAPPVRQAGSA